MATLRDQAISALTNSGASAALTGVGTALGLPAVKAAGAALALADSGAVPAAARRVREGVPSAARQVREALPFPPEDEDPFAGLDLGKPADEDEDPFAGLDLGKPVDEDEDPFAGLDLGKPVDEDEDPFAGLDLGKEVKPEIAVEAPAPMPEPVTLPGEPAVTTDVAAPGGVPVMRSRPLEKLGGAVVGAGQSMLDTVLTMADPGTLKGVTGEGAKRFSKSKEEAKQAIRNVIKERQGQHFASNVLEDAYDVVAAVPRLGLGLFAEEPVDVDQFERAREAASKIIPGAVGQLGMMVEDPEGYVRSMPVSAALDVAPLTKSLTKFASPLLPDSRLPAVRLDRARDEARQAAQIAGFERAAAERRSREADRAVSGPLGETLAEGEALRELERAQRQLDEVGAFAGYDDVVQAEDRLAQATERLRQAQQRREAAYAAEIEARLEENSKKAAREALDEEALEKRLTAPQSPVLEAIGKVTNPELVASLRRYWTQPSAQARPVLELAAEEMLRPADVIPQSVVNMADEKRREIRRVVDKKRRGVALEAHEQELLDRSPTFAKTGKLPEDKVLVREVLATLDPLADVESFRQKLAGERMIPNLMEAVPEVTIPTPPELRRIVDSDTITPGLVASLEPLVEPPLPKKKWVQVQDVIKRNLTTGSPVSIINNAASNLLLQTFRRGPVGVSALVPHAMIHTVNMLRPDWVPAAIRDRLAQYDRTYQILEDLKILDRDGLTVDANRAGMDKWADRISRFGTIGDVLPSAYQLGDKMFKLEETIHNLNKYRGYVDSLKPGQFVEFRMTPRHVLRVDNEGGKLVGRVFGAGNLQVGSTLRNFNTSLNKIQPELVRAAAQTGLDAFFDYSDVSNFVKGMRNAPIVGMKSPFLTWAYKAMDLPGKRGLGREALLGMGGVVKTNSGKISALQGVASLEQLAGRVAVLDAARRQLMQEDGAGARDIAEAFSYLPKEPKIQLLRGMTDPLTGAATNYGYLAQGGNYNFLEPTERLYRMILWGANSLFNSPQDMRDYATQLRTTKDMSPEDRLDAERNLELMYRVNSGRVSDWNDVLKTFGMGGDAITQIWLKLQSDEKPGIDVDIADLLEDVIRLGGFPASFGTKFLANANPDHELARPFVSKERQLVQADENLRQGLARAMLRSLIGSTWKLVPLNSALTGPKPRVQGELDDYFGKLRRELERSTGTGLKTIETLEAEAGKLERDGKITKARSRQQKANDLRELRGILFGAPANPKAGIPAVQGEFEVIQQDLYNTIDKLHEKTRQQRRQFKETP